MPRRPLASTVSLKRQRPTAASRTRICAACSPTCPRRRRSHRSRRCCRGTSPDRRRKASPPEPAPVKREMTGGLLSAYALTAPNALAAMINNADCGGLLGDVQSNIECHRGAPIGLGPGANRPDRETIGHPAWPRLQDVLTWRSAHSRTVIQRNEDTRAGFYIKFRHFHRRRSLQLLPPNPRILSPARRH